MLQNTITVTQWQEYSYATVITPPYFSQPLYNTHVEKHSDGIWSWLIWEKIMHNSRCLLQSLQLIRYFMFTVTAVSTANKTVKSNLFPKFVHKSNCTEKKYQFSRQRMQYSHCDSFITWQNNISHIKKPYCYNSNVCSRVLVKDNIYT